MDGVFPLFYLTALGTLLAGVGWLVIREIRRNRRQEDVLRRLQAPLSREKGSPRDHYELGSVYLEKKLYDQAIIQFKKGLEASGDQSVPPIANALGFTYFTQQQYDLAIRFYKEALKGDPDYVVAWNNLGHAYEKKTLVQPAIEAYETALRLEPENTTAKRRLDSLRKRLSPVSGASTEGTPPVANSDGLRD
ncbi:MAG: tetratricopeptide repeat protein [Synechococcales cyanobacterium]